jgi:sec-independent protein translocase protein TatC
MVPTSTAPIVPELMLEGANVILEPPRNAVLARVVRRAAGAAGKSKSKDSLVVLSPLEPFFAYIKIALVVGLFLATPIWLYQAWKFVAPGLYSNERRFLLPTVLSGSVLFIAGGAFAYFLMFPMMFDVLINQMMPANLVGTFTVDKYLSLLLRMTVAFGVVFETPLAMTLLAAVGIVTPEKLRQLRKYAIVVAFVLSAVLTPADPLSQVAMALPLIVFYEIGIFSASVVARKRERKLDDEE